MFQVKIRLFGSPRFERANQDIDFGTRKAVALIAYLAVTGQPHSRETLTTLLWPEYDYESASQAFRQTLYTARQRLDKSILPSIGKQIALDDSRNVWIDVKEFHIAVGTGLADDIPQHQAIEFLEQAVALYQADLLAGFSLKDSLAFDEWQLLETKSLRQTYGRVLETLVQYHSALGTYDQALDYALRHVQFDQLDEVAHRNVMHAYVQTGQRAAALRHYDEWAQILAQHLHIEPSVETRRLLEMIASEEPLPSYTGSVDAEPTPHEVPLRKSEPLIAGEPPAHGAALQNRRFAKPSPDTDVLKHNLPSQTTEFVGRETELAELAKLVDEPKCRLITILAPGGMGKSRLALEMAERIVKAIPSGRPQTAFSNGVWFIELAKIQSIEGIITTIADAVGFRFQGNRRSPKQQLLDFFRAKETLLIMDNFEHLLDGAGIVDEIVQGAPNVTIVATSREKLNLYGETVFTLDGLDIPDGQTLENALQYNAVKMFLNSARRVQPGYELRTKELDHLTHICRQCCGMPLAIELAASWAETLSLQEIAAEIAQNLDILETTLRNVPERHRSIRAVFDYSWNLLKEDERAIFVRFAVFRGSFSRKAAQAVTGVGLRQLTVLVNKSLLQRNADSGRYRVHELLRMYAEEELEARGDLQPMRNTHSKYYLQAIHDLKEDLDGKDQHGALKSVEIDIENAQAAVFHAVELGFYSELSSALYNLWRFYFIRGQFLLGELFFTQVVDSLKKASVRPERDLVLGEALAYQSFYITEHRNIQKAEVAIQASEMLLKDVSNPNLQALLACCRARCYIPLGDAQKARPLLEKAIKVYRQLGERYMEAHALHRLSNSYWLRVQDRDMAMATRYMEEAYKIRQEINDTLGIAWSLSMLGTYATIERRYDEGERLMLEGLALYRQIGHLEAAPHNLGVFAMRRGQWDKARQYMEESLTIAREQGDLNLASWRLWLFGNIEFYTGNFVRAKAFYTDGETLAKQVANTMWLVQGWNGLGSVALAVGNYMLAETLFHRGLETWQAEENNNLIAVSQRYLGQAAHHRGDYESAHEHFDQALAIFNELEDHGGRINTQRERALLYFDEGKMAEVRTTVEEILGFSSGDQSAEDHLNPLLFMITSIVCHTLLGAIASRERDVHKAVHHYQRVLQIAGQHYPAPYLLMFIGRTVEYFRNQGDYQRAAEIAAFVAHNERAFAYDRRHASALLAELNSRLDGESYKTVIEQAKSLDLETVIKALLAELGDGEGDSQ